MRFSQFFCVVRGRRHDTFELGRREGMTKEKSKVAAVIHSRDTARIKTLDTVKTTILTKSKNLQFHPTFPWFNVLTLPQHQESQTKITVYPQISLSIPVKSQNFVTVLGIILNTIALEQLLELLMEETFAKAALE